MTRYRRLFALLFVATLTSFNLATARDNPLRLTSPNNKIQVALALQADAGATGSQLFYSVSYVDKNKTSVALTASRLGLVRADEDFSTTLTFVKVLSTHPVTTRYELVHGKRKQCTNKGIEKVFRFANAHHKLLDIAFRAYDNGVTFRYSFPEAAGGESLVNQEVTQFNIPAKSARWMQSYTSSYEDFYNFSTTGQDPKQKQEFGFPALVKPPAAACYLLVTEANVSAQNCTTHLTNQANPDSYAVLMPEKQMRIALPWQSQWRVIVLGPLHEIVESTLVTDVSDPSQLATTAWIKPGSCAWMYWAYNHGSKDYALVKKYIDFGAAMGWPYVLIDWEWDVMANGGTITDAITYAQQKGVKPILWYNSGDASNGAPGPWSKLTTPEARAKEFAWLNQLGVAGIKVDFFDGDQQKVMQYYIDLMRDAAQHHLLVNFHGATVPKGWSRTFPNLMSTEAVYGAEWYNNGPTMTKAASQHNATLPFTRNVVGPMDYTPVTFLNSQNPHITSYGHELALAVVFESGLQNFADKPEAYEALPSAPKAFLKTVPAAWDDTKLLDGYPGEKVLMARRKGDTWYIGGLNGKDSSQVLKVDLRFLDGKTYALELISDGKSDQEFTTQHLNAKKGQLVQVTCLPRGGFVAVLKPSRESSPKKNLAR